MSGKRSKGNERWANKQEIENFQKCSFYWNPYRWVFLGALRRLYSDELLSIVGPEDISGEVSSSSTNKRPD